MTIQEQIIEHIASQPEAKLTDMKALHLRILKKLPAKVFNMQSDGMRLSNSF